MQKRKWKHEAVLLVIFTSLCLPAGEAAEDRRQDYERGIQAVRESGILETAVQSADQAPGFTLPDASGQPVSLDSLLKQGPVILVWYRGGWCPYCNRHLQALQAVLPEIKAAGASLVAVSPELPQKALSTKQKQKLGFYVLSDRDNRVAAEYGIVFTLPDYVKRHYREFFSLEEYNGDTSGRLPLAASYVIRPDGKITYAFLDADYKKRAEPGVLLQQLRRLDQKNTQAA